jgi:ABC-type dipeptide/oligopeptide/nickel transport system permease component
MSFGAPEYAFAGVTGSLLITYVFMLGGFDPAAFDGLPAEEYSVLLAVLFTVLVTILLLNLLIALMGSIFDEVQEKGTL